MSEVRIVRIDAKTYQEQLGKLAATMVELLMREGQEYIPGPKYVAGDLATMLRYGASVYNLLNYLNADERRKGDCYWYVRYGVTGMSLVRSLIDCLYNVTAILENPTQRAVEYRKSGLKKAFVELDELRIKYSDQPEFEGYIAQRRRALEILLLESEFTIDEIETTPRRELWPTFGTYINTQQEGGTLTDNQKFLKTFAHLEWRQYSALTHGAYEAFIGTLGHIPVGAYYLNDFLPHENRENVEESYDLFVSTHLGRAATVLLCVVTELQAYCRFDCANVDHRICEVWAALLPFPSTRELFEARYST
jgi:hypothetical protein